MDWSRKFFSTPGLCLLGSGCSLVLLSAIAVLRLNGSPVLHGAAPLLLVPPGSCVALLLVFVSHVSIFLLDRQLHAMPDRDIYPPSRVMFVDKVWYVFDSCSAAVLT